MWELETLRHPIWIHPKEVNRCFVDSEGAINSIHSNNAAFKSIKIRDFAKIKDRSDGQVPWRWQQQAGCFWYLKYYHHYLKWLILELLSQQFGRQEFLSGEENESVLEAEFCRNSLSESACELQVFAGLKDFKSLKLIQWWCRCKNDRNASMQTG